MSQVLESAATSKRRAVLELCRALILLWGGAIDIKLVPQESQSGPSRAAWLLRRFQDVVLEGKFIQVLLSMGFRVVEQDLIVCDVKYLILVIDGVDFLASDTDERLLALASGGGHLLLEPANRPLVKPFGAQMYFFSEGKASTATMVASGVSFTNSRSLPLSALCTDGHDPLVMPLCSRGDDKTMDSFLFHLAHILGCVSPSAIGSPAATVGKTLESLQGPFESPSSTQEYCKTSAANQGLPPFDLHEAIARTLSAEF